MEKKYNKIQWIVQNNLTKPELMEDLKGACKKLEVDHIEVKVVPFSSELPEFPENKDSIYYGSTTMMYNVYKRHKNSFYNPGLFFDEYTFTMENYFKQWGKHMLNYDAGLTTFRELMMKEYAYDHLLFIRPNDDSKSFAGEVVEFNRIQKWYENLIGYENINLTLDTKIVAGEPYAIKKEWRLWIVNERVIASTQYKDGQFLKKIEGAPQNVIDFAEARCKEYTPHDIFVMDICLCGDELFILECGCMNSAGFYAANVYDIVSFASEAYTNLDKWNFDYFCSPNIFVPPGIYTNN